VYENLINKCVDNLDKEDVIIIIIIIIIIIVIGSIVPLGT